MSTNQAIEPSTEELAEEYRKDRAELGKALVGLKSVTASLVGMAVAASFLVAMWVGINPNQDVMMEHAEAMDENTSSAWLCAVILSVAGAILIGHRVGERIASKVLDAKKGMLTRVVYGVLLFGVFAGLTPLLPLQVTFVGIVASVLASQFEPKKADQAAVNEA